MRRVHRRCLDGYRRTKVTAAAVVCIIAATTFVGTGTGGAAPEAPGAPAQVGEPGSASALAQIAKVNPRAGSLSIGVTNGISLADYQNYVARAESRAVDLGIIGSLLAAKGCSGGDPTLPAEDQPQSVRAEARGAPQSTGEVPEDKVGGLMTKFAEATPQPFSRAVTTTSAQEIIPGLLSVGAGRSETTTQFVDGVRIARSVSDISGLTIGPAGPGQVKMVGLHWEAVHASDGTRTGIFSIGGASQTQTVVHQIPVLGGILGPAFEEITETLDVPLAVNDPAMLLSTIAAELPAGVSLVMPVSAESAGIQFVDPLKIGVVPNALRDTLIKTVMSGVAPVRQPVIDALFEADCRTEDLVTVADITVGTLSGTGDFHLELGGVSATTRDLAATCFLCSGTNLGVGPVNLPGLSALPGSAAVPGTPGAPGSATSPAAGSTQGGTEEAAELAGSVGKRGGPLALVALIGLGLLGLVAEADRRKMRKAQRLIPLEA